MNYFKTLLIIMMFGLFTNNSLMAQFGLVSPADSALCVTNTYEFEWNVEQNQVSFEIQIGYDSDFNFLAYRRAGLNLNTHEATLPFADSTYFWRVKAYDVDDNEVISETRMFRTTKYAPDILFPLHMNYCVHKETEVIWSDYGADAYEFIVFSDVALSDTVINKTNLQDTSFAFTLPEYNHEYFWTVRGIFGGCSSDWASINRFRTVRAPAVNFLPEDKAIGLPVPLDTTFRVRFQWDHVDTNDVAEMFVVQVSDTNDFSRLTYDTLFSSDKREILLYFPKDYNKQYFWRVQQEFIGCITEWSEPTSFKLQYAPPQLELPADGRFCVPINADFKWQPVEGASAYTIQICDSADFTSDTVYTFFDLDTTGLNFDLQENMEMFYWRVRASDVNNIGLWSDTFSFMTRQSTPEIVYPPDGSAGIDRYLTFKWQNKGEDAIYDFVLSEAPDFDSVMVDTSVQASEFYYELPEFNKNYFWKIRVAFSDSTYRCESNWSDVFTFRTQLQAPNLISPADSAENVPLIPRFEWTDVETAEYYEIAFSYDPSMEYIIIYRDSIPNTFAQISAFKFNENTTYYWYVRSSNKDGKSLWSEVNMFTTGIDIPERPMLISPVNGQKKLPKDSVTLVWHKEMRAAKYLLEVSTDPYFQTGMLADTIITDTTFTLYGLENYVTYNWRVKSLNDFGESLFTAPWSFRVIDVAPTEAPVLFSPKNNAENLPREQTLSWSEVPNAYGYEVQVATSETFDEASIVEGRRQNWEPVLYIYNLDYDTKYFWRARGWSEAADGPWSDIFNFTTEIDVSVNDGIFSGFDAKITPNPVSENAELLIQMPQSGKLKAEIFDISGNYSDIIIDRFVEKGMHKFTFDAGNYSSGTYLIKITNDEKVISGKFIIQK
jgi:hypothetical protein